MIKISITTGDFIDRYTIARLKHKNQKLSEDQWAYYEKTLERLVKDEVNTKPAKFVMHFMDTMDRLERVNSDLWEVEDRIRQVYDRNELADKVIDLNDERSRVKRELDLMFGDRPDSKVYAGKNGYDI